MQTSPEQNGEQADALERLTRLQALTASLSEAMTSEQVADAILAQTAVVLSASAGVVYHLSDDNTEFVCLRTTGYPEQTAAPWRRLPTNARTPLCDAVRDRRPVLLASLAEREVRYPEVACVPGVPTEGALAALPLVVRDRAIGGMGLRFPTERIFTPQDRAFLLTIAGLCAQALERGRLYDTERAARERAEQATEALRANEERFVRFMQHLPGLAWAKDSQGRYVFANDAAVRAFRTPRTSLYGKTDDEVFPPATATQFRENDQKALAGRGGVRVVETLEHEDGVLHYSLVSKFPIPGPDGAAALVGGMAIDITEEMRTRAVLEESEERFRATFEQAAVGIAHVGLDGRWLRVNRKLCEIVGYRPDELLALRFQDITHPDDLEADLAYVQRLLAGDVKTYSMEKRYFRKDRSLVWINLTVSLVRTSQSRPKYFISVVEDITKQKGIRDALRESEGRLREADRRKDEFLAILAHELRNPLAPIRNGLHVMKLARSDAAVVGQTRDMMERQLRQMVRLIDDLLDVSRITRGKLELRKERVTLMSVVQSAVEGSRPLVEASAHRLTVSLPSELVPLDADPVRLAQVFANLLTNAAKYTDRGGNIQLAAERSGGEIMVSVRDSGIGLAPEHLPRLFEMFSQVKTTLERSQGGLGIGLALVKGLVEMHGGRVEARSEGLGKGSEFIVRLPVLDEGNGQGGPQPIGGGRAAGPRKRILVADDNRDAADSLSMMIRLAGHEVHTAYDGQEAAEATCWFRPDAALLDIGMPKLNGYDACRRIREQPGGREILLVALTGWGQEEDKRRAREAGFDEHLTKPVDPAALEKLLAGSRADMA